MIRPALLLTILLLIAHGASASMLGAAGEVTFDAVLQGPSMLHGGLRGLFSAMPSTGGPSIPPGSDPVLPTDLLQLSAEQMTVARHWVRSDATVLGAIVGGQENESSVDFAAAGLSAQAARAGYTLFIAPLSSEPVQASWAVGPGQLAATQDTTLNEPTKGAASSPRQTDIAQTTKWQGQATLGSTLVLQGDFLLSLYDVDVSVDDGAGQHTFTSGTSNDNVGGTTPEMSTAGSSESAILRIFVHQGTLTWTLMRRIDRKTHV